MDLKEKWKTVPDFTDYEVSNTGKIRVVSDINKRLYKYTNFKGHKVYILTASNKINTEAKRKAFSLHSLVADLFIPKIDGLDGVKHIDFNEDNNAVDNLERCDISDSNIVYPILTDKIKERWKIIKDYPLYMVSNHGRVKNIQTDLVLKPSLNKSGHIRIGIRNKKGSPVSHFVHRLVAKAFLPIIKGKDIINHIDGIPDNNVVTNLEWCTYKENAIHAIDTGLSKIGENHTGVLLTNEEVKQICELLMDLSNSISEISKMFSVSSGVVYKIYAKNSWKSISKDFNFPTRPKRNKLNKKTAYKVCVMLLDLNNSFKFMSEKFNVSVGTIYEIYMGKNWKTTSHNFDFPIRKTQIKLNETSVKEIVNMFKLVPKLTNTKIGDMFNVNNRTISSVRTRTTWSEITKDLKW